MAGSCRKAVALLAAYAIALQALLAGMLVVAHDTASADPFSVICTSDGSGHASGQSDNLPQHTQRGCGACGLACGHAPVLTPSATTVLLLVQPERAWRKPFWLKEPHSAARHEPHASRAPPSLV